MSRTVRGVRYQVPQRVIQGIVGQPRFAREAEQLGATLGLGTDQVVRLAVRRLRRMVGSPSALLLDLRRWLDRRLWLRGYAADVQHDKAAFARLRATMRGHPTVLLFTHKAYGDAALPGLLCFENDLPMLHTFGGANLDLPVFGALMRRTGGIFIRRGARADPLDRFALRSCAAYLLGQRLPMSWAMEGTRSRLGKLMPPRLGLMKYVLEAAREAGIEAVHFVPFVTSFELVRDVDEFVAEQAGGAKRAESIGWLLSYARGSGSPLGRVRVDLGDPVVVRPPAEGDDLGVARAAFEVAVQANRATPLTVTGAMCLVLLGLAPRGASPPELVKLVQVLGQWARERSIRLSDELAADEPAAFFARLDALAAAGLLTRSESDGQARYAVHPARHREAGFYRNTVVHHFVAKAFVELALARALEQDGAMAPAFWQAADRLRELFKFEFFYPPRDAWRRELEDELARADPHWQQHLSGDAAAAGRLQRRLQPLLAHAALWPYAESYAVVFDVLSSLEPGEHIDESTCVERALARGRQAWDSGELRSEASLATGLFAHAYRLAAHLGLAAATTESGAAGRRALSREFQALARRMERLRECALRHAEEVMTLETAR